MSYPEIRYDGESGEVTAWMRPASAPADLTSKAGTKFGYLATGADTGGDFGLYRLDMLPRAGGASDHFHRTITESFFILSGTMKLFNGDKWVDAREGDFLHVPPGGRHGFRNESDEPASMLLLFTPGAPREAYFEGLKTVSGLSDQERLEFFLQHDNHFVD
ncbi:cupin domain-containing protein [Kutzneria sp. NPDC051319]|uniref:cupin domain-containing protein n=1 Tax=Kutzneria sp. NPDC051319 TaxID=3155047 RepID=UPI0034343A96